MNKMKPLFLALIMLTASLAGCLGGDSEIPDEDYDGVEDGLDICPQTPGQGVESAKDLVDEYGCSQYQYDQGDTDGDEVMNKYDLCGYTPTGEAVNADGCAQSQLDEDEDGVMNNLDLCPLSSAGETVDADGCLQSQLDDDGDGVMNDADLCPNTHPDFINISTNYAVLDTDGCSQSQKDDDGDGVMNNLDLCDDYDGRPYSQTPVWATPAGETVDADGCAQSQIDDDGDGVMNNLDNCPQTPIGEIGYGANAYYWSGNTRVFDETLYDINSTALGCSQSQFDDDADGVWNDIDLCALTPPGEVANADGCSQSQLDDDSDGVMNNLDLCLLTPPGESVDADGCSQSQIDDDGDGVMNNLDLCPSTTTGETVDADGCSQTQLDDDADGVMNGLDHCQNTPTGETVDANGCSQSQLDDDNDGIMNDIDQCLNTSSGSNVDATGCGHYNDAISAKNIWGLHTLNDVMYFFSADLENGLALWKDDPINGVTLVKIVNPAENGIWHSSLSISKATNCGMIKVSEWSGDTLYFFADDGINGTELWKSDGTDAGTIMVKDINPAGSSRWGHCHNSNSPWTNPVATGAMIYFWANDGTHGYELWKSDGTEIGTVIVKDITSGTNGSFDGSDLVIFGNTLYFSAMNDTARNMALPPTNFPDLWKSDGTEIGTVKVTETEFYDIEELTVAGNTLYFMGDGKAATWPADKGRELWMTDGTDAGTVMVKDIRSGKVGSYVRSFTSFGDVYFVADDGTHGYELWKSDGTETGTVMVKDISVGSSNSYPSQLTVVDNVLYFLADDGINGCKLWKSEGHESNTVMVNSTVSHDCYTSGTNEYFLNFGASLYFRSDSGSSNFSGWVSDGTPERTNAIEGFNASDSVRGISQWLFIHGNNLYIQVMSAPGIVTLVKISI
ncbi:thrombospondin type 3 repeat-containing protein [Candidatus Poseidonia alphae]|nr:thrombospondin type 3 repeat-containing protein [Candidatus Poseidonia alphae]